VVDLKARQARPIAGESDGAPRVYDGVMENASASMCTASVSMAGTDFSTSGWPRA
jgi:hypothetical protein